MSEYIIKAADFAIDYKGESLFKDCEPIVRCRDCKHMIHFWHHDDERWQCANEMLDGLDVSPSFYCAWGERKENRKRMSDED